MYSLRLWKPKDRKCLEWFIKTALDAFGLHSVSEEICPYLKDILIDKYPEIVLSNSLDAGSVALTLVVTQKCLREGET